MKRSDAGQLKNGLFSSRELKSMGALSVAAFLILTIILAAQKSAATFESPILLALLNTVFLCAIPLFVAYRATKSHHATGVFAFLMVGCGLVFFGVSSLYAGWVMPLTVVSNPTVTLHNLGALFAGICQLLSAHFFLQELAGVSEIQFRVKRSGTLYAGIIVLVSITAVLAFRGSLPVFFDPLAGASLLRQLVLGGAICLFGVAGLAFVEIYATTKTGFAYWYGMALWLIAVGLIGVLLQPSVGSALGWAGRGAQYLGCVYFIFAFLQGRGELVSGSSFTTQADWALWPYLEQRVNERTTALVQLNRALQKETTERKQIERAVRASEKYVRSIIDCSLDMIITTDLERKIVEFNRAAQKAFGYTRDEVLGQPVDLLYARSEDGKMIRQEILTEGKFSGEVSNQRKNGQIFVSLLSASVLRGAQGEIFGVVGISRDVTLLKQIQADLRESEEKYRTVANFAYDWEMWRAPSGNYVYVSFSCERITGHTAAEFLADPNLVMKIAHPADASQVSEHYDVTAHQEMDQAGQLDFRILTSSGEMRWINHNCRAVFGEAGQWLGRRESNRDITERKRLEEDLQRRATTDELTGIANRRYFIELAHRELKRTVRLKHPLALALIDLDRFKQINDMHGHATGDQALSAFTKICQKNIREIDLFARFGGDEFVLLLPETDREQAFEAAERVRLALETQPIDVEGKSIALAVSAGIACFTEEHESLDALLGRADQALYRAKETGRNRVVIASAGA